MKSFQSRTLKYLLCNFDLPEVPAKSLIYLVCIEIEVPINLGARCSNVLSVRRYVSPGHVLPCASKHMNAGWKDHSKRN